MKKKFAVAAIVLGAIALLFFFLSKKPAVPPIKTESAQDAAVAKAFATANPQVNAVIASNFAVAPAPQTIFYAVPSKPSVAPSGKPSPLEYTNLAPEIVLNNVRHAIADYGAMCGGNPVGVNSEITSQLNGNNPKQANFIRPEAGMRINERGELVDPWGTAYFFHQLSGKDTEIRSAGPDKTMWTADDLVTE
jgi:hypothetical protein